MRPRTSRAIALSLAASLSLAAPSAQAAPTERRRARVGSRYLVSQQGRGGAIAAFTKFGSTADAIVAMVAAKRAPGAIRAALRYLRRHPRAADSIGLRAKLVLAVVAAGRNPRSFAQRNWVARLRHAETASGRYGRGAPVFEHALAVLALEASGRGASDAAIAWLRRAQCADGGWQYDSPPRPPENRHCRGPDPDFYTSEADATALAVQALAAAGAEPVRDALAFFDLVRDLEVKGGWGYNHRFDITNANSTGLVLQAYAAEGVAPPARAVRALARLQYRLCGRNAGAFAFGYERRAGNPNRYRRTGPDVGATIGAIPGLLGRALPIAAASDLRRAPRTRRC